MPLPPDYKPSPVQVVGPKLFGSTAEFLKAVQSSLPRISRNSNSISLRK